MGNQSLLAIARELYNVHGILPVAASGKMPMGGSGWNMLPLDVRLLYFDTPGCTGVGFQCGLIFHPVWGPITVRILDLDERDPVKRDAFMAMFLHLLGPAAKQIVWRWGRGPAAVLFTRGELPRERYGSSIQLLGAGKYAVGWGAHPDIAEGYRWPYGDIFSVMPPVIDTKTLDACILTAAAHAGIPVQAEKTADIKSAVPITEEQLAQLNDTDLARYHEELTTELRQIGDMPFATGRGTRLYSLGLRFGAIARHDTRLGKIVADALAILPGDANHGDVRDFSRGLDESKGLALLRTAEANAQRSRVLEALKPKGAAAPGQELTELLQEHIPPLRWLVDKFLPHVGTLALVGKPKIGKSFLVLELGLSIAEGGTFWGERCHACGVLLYMLEDSKRRVKQRVVQLRPELRATKATFRIRYGRDGPFRVNPDGSGGLLDDIRKHKHDYPDIGFIAIDMWKLVRGTAEKGLDAYQATSQLVAPLSALAQELDITILLVHHARKGKIDPDDVGDAASGSNALQGATEGTWTIWKEGTGARIVAEVRETENFDMQLEKKEGALVWNPLEGIRDMRSLKDKVYNLVIAAGCELTPSDVAYRMKIDLRVANARLHELRNEGSLQNPRHGHYRIAGAMSRLDGIYAGIMRTGVVRAVTLELRALHDPDGKNSHMGDADATGFAFADEVINAIEVVGFADGKATLKTLHTHKLVVEKRGIVWFFGASVNREQQPLPWAAKYPWSK